MKRPAVVAATLALGVLAAAATLTCYKPALPSCISCTAASGCPGELACVSGFCAASAGDDVSMCSAIDAGADGSLAIDASSDAAGPIGAYKEIAAGGVFSCAIDQMNALWCWGRNLHGELARDPAALERSGHALQMDGGTAWHGVEIGFQHGCALSGTELYCWGFNNLYQIADTSTVVAELLPIPGQWKSVTAGSFHTCAIDMTDRAFCWGSNVQGELGRGTQGSPEHIGEVVLGAAPANAWKQLSAGGEITCGIDAQDDLYCWGGLFYLGVDPEPMAGEHRAPVAVTVGAETGWLAVASGDTSSCAIGLSGKLWCWGSNSSGQLGVTGLDRKPEPVQVGLDTTWTAISLYDETACGIRGGVAVCSGAGAAGQLGLGTWEVRATAFAPVIGTPGVTAVSAGERHACALVEAGRAVCWGANAHGELGDGRLADGITPTQTGNGAWEQVALGVTHSCGIRADQRLFCWGQNDRGQLGTPASVLGSFAYDPVEVDPGGAAGGWQAVEVGDGVSCGLRSGQIWCWGDNTDGRAGLGASNGPFVPARIDGVVGQFQQLSVGDASSCAIRAGNQRYCWGKSDQQQLGRNSITTQRMPVLVADGIAWDSVAMGGVFGCGYVNGGMTHEIKCWGARDHGQVGDNVIGPTPLGTPYDTASGFPRLVTSGGPGHGCVIGTLGFMMCWGANEDGMLGTGLDDFADKAVVTAVSHDLGAGTFTDVALGHYHSCAIFEGQIFCWGDNFSGQLGEFGPGYRTTIENSPIGVGTTWTKVMADGFGTCALDDSDQLWCWGENLHGQFGNGAGARPAPVDVVQMP